MFIGKFVERSLAHSLLTEQNYQKAAQLSQKACNSGVAEGCAILGILYQDGKGVKQNFSTAKQYYGKACDLGLQPGCDIYRELNEKGY